MLAIRSDAGDIAGQRVVAKAVGDAFGALEIAVLKWASEFVIDGGMSNLRTRVAGGTYSPPSGLILRSTARRSSAAER
jgi:hypothetical protein